MAMMHLRIKYAVKVQKLETQQVCIWGSGFVECRCDNVNYCDNVYTHIWKIHNWQLLENNPYKPRTLINFCRCTKLYRVVLFVKTNIMGRN